MFVFFSPNNIAITFRNETKGMLAKAKTQVIKLSPIFSSIRQTGNKIEVQDDSPINFVVTEADVNSAWVLVQMSMHTFTEFKDALKQESQQNVTPKKNRFLEDESTPSLLSIEDITEDLVFSNINKIVKMYNKTDNEGRVSSS